MVAICKADKHKLIAEAPVDINIGKQVNILLADAGLNVEDIVMIQTTAALGYGFDYVYTILERARIAGLRGDKLMASPQICDVGGETWRVKEALSDEDALPGWGRSISAAKCGRLYAQQDTSTQVRISSSWRIPAQ